MKLRIVGSCLILLVCSGAFAQQAAPASVPATGSEAAAPSPEQAGIDATLKAYVNAYGSRQIDDLVAVWPELQNEKKEYKKIKAHLTDTQISNDRVSLNSCKTQIVKADAVVQCDRTEEFIKTETQTSYGGDAMMASPAQRPPPSDQELKHNIKKSGMVWMKLHEDGGKWKIVSVSEKPLSM